MQYGRFVSYSKFFDVYDVAFDKITRVESFYFEILCNNTRVKGKLNI